MYKDRFTYLVGGKAGEGVKKAGLTASALFASNGLNVFQMDDYQSLIKGGHNFSVVSVSKRPITSHYMKADLVVALDKKSYGLHREHISEDGILVFNSDTIDDVEGIGIPMKSMAKGFSKPDLILGVSAVAVLAAAIGIPEGALVDLITKEYPKNLEENIDYGKKIFDAASEKIKSKFELDLSDSNKKILTGNEAIALGAAAGGLDIYIAYPMTPSTSVLHYLAAAGDKLGIITVHPENEIAVINMAIGAASAGARAMVGSSGGGFALMQEAFSLAGMTETPLLCFLSSRPGPSTGVPTYTAQGDLNFALYQGHGEFPRLVASPGSIEEAFYLTSEMLELVWRFQTPGILLTEKHLSESSMTVELYPEQSAWVNPIMSKPGGAYKRYLDTADGISPLQFPPSPELIKWNSYEHDELGITTEDPEVIVKMRDKLNRKQKTIIEHMKKLKTVNVFGSGEGLIFTYGSTTMSVLEAVHYAEIDCTVVQPIYLDPFPLWEFAGYNDSKEKRKKLVVEQSVTGQFEILLKEKAGFESLKNIRQYDGRPFDPIELSLKLKEAF